MRKTLLFTLLEYFPDLIVCLSPIPPALGRLPLARVHRYAFFIGETLGERAANTAAANLFFSLVDAGVPFSGVGGVSGRGVDVLGLSDNVGGV